MRTILTLSLVALTMALFAAPATAAGWGPRLGLTDQPNDLYLGLGWDTNWSYGSASFAPSLDVEFGDADATALNADLRWDLLPIPDSDVSIYGKAGPSLFIFDGGNELGLSLTAGLELGMRGGRRLQTELRFGFGDVPDLKIGAGLMF